MTLYFKLILNSKASAFFENKAGYIFPSVLLSKTRGLVLLQKQFENKCIIN